MNNMFSDSKATTLDLSSFDTSNVTDMRYMFYFSKATTLDLSSFDTSNVTNTARMFQDSGATTGYARTQADADRFNASSYKPAGLNFVVKP
jgi:surface protein